MNNKLHPKYPLFWQKDDFTIKIFCSTPNLATGIVISANDKIFVVDPGDGILRDLNKEIGKKNILKISDIFVSHGHHDHIGGLWSLLTYLSVMQRKETLTIHAPKNSIEIKSILRAFHEVYSKDLTYKVQLIDVTDKKAIPFEHMEVIPFEVNHREPGENGTVPIPSVGFKFIYDNKTICYGGDTAYCENIVEMAKDSDLAIIEAGAEDEKYSDLHLTPEQATEIGSSAKEYFLVHIPE